MLNLTPHTRFHVPNGLAMLAAVLLLASSVTTVRHDTEAPSSSADTNSAIQLESVEKNTVPDTVEEKRRGLNLDFLLFRRG